MKKHLLILLLFPFCTYAQDQKWTPDEIIHTDYLSSPQFSPDGTMVLWTQRKGLEEEDKFVNHLYLARLNEEHNSLPRTVQLTRSKDSDHSALIGRTNEYIYFLSSRDKGKKLWRLSLFGGEPEELHEFKNGISAIQWQNDQTLFFIASEGDTYYDIVNKKDDTEIVEDTAHWAPRRVFSYDLEKKQVKRITENTYRISSFDLSKNGQWMIYTEVVSPDFGADSNPKAKVMLMDLNTGKAAQILEELQQPGSFRFPDQSGGFYFTAVKSSNPQWNGAGISELYYYEIASGTYSKVELDWENGLSDYYLSGENVLAELANGPLLKLRYYRKGDSNWTPLPIELGDKQEHVSILSVSEKGDKVIYTHSTASRLPEYYYATLEAGKKAVRFEGEKKLASLNDNLKKKPLAVSEVIYWKGANDEEVNGILYYPKNYEKGKKYPLILSIHGGPTGVDRDTWSERWSTYPQIFTDKGAFVLKPNYHGSGSHSLEFIESIKNGKYYSLEQVDLYNGIQHLNQLGLIDMDKLGTMGWSNGAILTTMLTLKYPDMFKVAAPGAGDVNWTSDYGTCQFGVSFDQSYFGGAPWDDINGKSYNEWYIENSPIFEIEKIKTPTIIFHGSEDRAVPRDQGWEYYRGLQQVGKAPVKFLWFPGQPHGLQKITHQRRKMKEEIAWIDKYLFDKDVDENESFKKDSPLAARILVDSMAQSDGLIGKKGNILLPPLKQLKDSISIGLFEVTIAQYAAYSGEEISAADRNKPVTGLDAGAIQGYLNWLSAKTGKTCRLPNKKEAEALHKKARAHAGQQNNLNYWAGYELTLPDARDLTIKLEGLEHSLIDEVGRRPMVALDKHVFIFDIGGNVAEYYLEGDTLKSYDYSAYDFVDPASETSSSAAAHTGFRVVMEE